MVNTGKIRFFFRDTSSWYPGQVEEFINRYLKGYEKPDSFFQTDLARSGSKLTYYVYEYPYDVSSKEKIGSTDPIVSICYITKIQSVGHEMTHALSYWGWGLRRIKGSRLVNGGLAVAFDLSDDDYILAGRRSAIYYNIHSVLDIWDYLPSAANGAISDPDFYRIAGAFMYYMYQNSTYDEFKRLIKNQTIANAEKVYGSARFRQIIDCFDGLMGFQN